MNVKFYFRLIIISLILFSCQNEIEEEGDDNQNPKSTNIVANSSLANLITRVSQNPTSIDNVLDKTSCFSIVLPVTVTVNSQIIVVSSPSNYLTVQNNINAYSNDDDIIHFTYPITIKFKNFSNQVINNSTELTNVINNCQPEDGFDEIDCISINFPISINIYDSNNQIANTLTIQNNSQLYEFIKSLSTGMMGSIVYPISATNSSGQNIIINNNSELETFIEDSIDDCNNSGSGSNPTLTSVVTSGTWRITYFYDDVDETSDYNGYNFTFNSNGNSIAVKNSSSIYGSWSTYVGSSGEKFNLSYYGSVLEEIEEDWRLIEFTTNQIRLKDLSTSNGETKYLYFTKN